MRARCKYQRTCHAGRDCKQNATRFVEDRAKIATLAQTACMHAHAPGSLWWIAARASYTTTVSASGMPLTSWNVWRPKVWRYGCMTCGVAETPPVTERRLSNRNDRRAHSRSGRRSTDPRMNWRRIAWLFAAYAAYLSVRSLSATVRDAVPAKLKKLFKREETAA